MAGVTSGTTSRFTTGEMSASRPNEARTTGSVAACAARETPRLSLSQRGRRPPGEPVERARSTASPRRRARPSRASIAGTRRRPRGRARRGAAGTRPSRGPRPRGRCDPTRGPAGRRRPSPRPAGPTARRRRTRCTRRRRRGDDRPTPTTEPPGHRPDGGRDDGDVPARDRHDMTDAGGRERRRDVAVDAVAQADEDSGREPGLRLGQDPGQRLAGVPAPALEPRAGIDGAGERPPSTARRACPTHRVARGTAPYGLSGRGLVLVRRPSRGRRARSPDSAAAWPQAGTRPSRRPRCGASRPDGPRAASRPSRRPWSTGRCPTAHPSAAARRGRG